MEISKTCFFSFYDKKLLYLYTLEVFYVILVPLRAFYWESGKIVLSYKKVGNSLNCLKYPHFKIFKRKIEGAFAPNPGHPRPMCSRDLAIVAICS